MGARRPQREAKAKRHRSPGVVSRSAWLAKLSWGGRFDVACSVCGQERERIERGKNERERRERERREIDGGERERERRERGESERGERGEREVRLSG